jgi:replicative DNA helicase
VRDGSRLENYIAIDDEAAPQLGDVVARCTELKAKQPKLQIIAVDYIQLVQNKLHGRRGDEEINEVCRALKGLALRLEVVMLAPAQANYKEVEARNDKRCELRDFQGASGMVQYGDFVATIYNERQYSPRRESGARTQLPGNAENGEVDGLSRLRHPLACHLREEETADEGNSVIVSERRVPQT